jgi:hypothetical protein
MTVWHTTGVKSIEDARRILIDSLADLRISAGDQIRFQEFIYSALQRFSRQGISVLMTLEIPHLFGADRISDSAASPLSDNVVMLSYQRDGDTISRTIAVIKTCASRHDPMVRKFVIGPQGVVLDEVLQPPGLTPSPRPGKRPLPSEAPHQDRTSPWKGRRDGPLAPQGYLRLKLQVARLVFPGCCNDSAGMPRWRHTGEKRRHAAGEPGDASAPCHRRHHCGPRGCADYETISSYPGEASKAITVLMPVGLPRISSAACSGG